MRSSDARSPTPVSAELLLVGYVLLHPALAATDLVDPVFYPFGPPWSPVAGLILAVLLRVGPAAMPLVAAVTTICAAAIGHAGWQSALADGLGRAMFYGLMARLLIRRFALDTELKRQRDVLTLLAGATIAAACHAALLTAVRHGYPSFGGIFLRLWVSDLLGVVVVAPFLLLALGRERFWRPSPEHLAEGAIIFLVLWVDFGLHPDEKFRFFYLLIMPLVWIASRHGLKGAAAAIALAQLGVLVAIRVVPFRDPSLTLLQLIMLSFSVTTLLLGSLVSSQRLANAAVAESRQRLEAILGLAPDGVMSFDQDGVVESANHACETMFGATLAELVGGPLDRVLPQLDPSAPALRLETTARRLDGKTFPVGVATVTALGSGGQRLTVAVIRDISRRKADEARRWERHIHFEKAARLNVSERLATALAHQLNQPLTAVIGYTRASQRLLRSGNTPLATVLEVMDKAVAQSERASEIIRSTRDFFSSGEVRAIEIALGPLLAETAGLSASLYAARGVTLEQKIAADLPPVLADALQIEQVVANLLQNALDAVVQADPPDRRVVLSAKAEGPDVVRVAVADRGAGIDPQIAGTLFNPFATSKPGGMGMGLFIARSIVEAHGGSMEVDSHPGDGATFSFTLPTMTRSDDVAS